MIMMKKTNAHLSTIDFINNSFSNSSSNNNWASSNPHHTALVAAVVVAGCFRQSQCAAPPFRRCARVTLENICGIVPNTFLKNDTTVSFEPSRRILWAHKMTAAKNVRMKGCSGDHVTVTPLEQASASPLDWLGEDPLSVHSNGIQR